MPTSAAFTTPSLRSAQTSSFRKSALERYKTEVSLEDFVDTFVPGLPENLEVSLVLQHMLNFKTWKGLWSYDTNDFFKQLFDEMVNVAQFVWEEMCPEQRWSVITGAMPNAPETSSSIRPDAFFYRTGKQHSDSQSYSYYHTAFTADFKKSADSLDNTSNVVEAMQYIMATDARRRFVFGITVKNASLRLWYANRAILVCSTPLDIVKDEERCLRVLLSFAFASDVDMGLDPSVELVESTEGSFYHINVNDVRYKTLAILQDHRPDALLSRGARVFKVKRVGDPEDQINVLKDLWIEKDRKPEHRIYEEIVEDVGRLCSEKDADTIKQYLLTPINSAMVKVNGIEDDTGTSMMRRHRSESSINDARLPIRLPSHDAARCGNASTRSSDMELDAVDDIKYAQEKDCRRSHYRVVFKEYATTISRVRMMGDVFIVLADLMKVFRLLHGSGWVHRDISIGNMYLYEGRGLLGDFEFAQNMADHSQPEVRKGTINFMAVEAMRMEFTFHPVKEWNPALDIDKPYEKIKEELFIGLPFCYNATHDIESAWWVGVWMLFFHMPKGYTESNQISSERQRQTDRVFSGTLNFDYRLRVLDTPGTFVETTIGWVSKECSPAVGVFDCVRHLLLKIYRDLEETFPDGVGKLSEKAQARQDGHHVAFPGGPEEDIYKPIHDAFLAAKELYESRETEIVRVQARESHGIPASRFF